MKKKIKDITFKEFDAWANQRACDGRWSFSDASLSIKAVGEVMNERAFLKTVRDKKREKKWNEIKGEYFNLEAELDV